jgi:Fe-S-cluster-containing dehydrogenase component
MAWFGFDEQICTACQACLAPCDLCIDQAGREYGPPCAVTCPGGALSFKKVDAAEKKRHPKAVLLLMV